MVKITIGQERWIKYDRRFQFTMKWSREIINKGEKILDKVSVTCQCHYQLKCNYLRNETVHGVMCRFRRKKKNAKRKVSSPEKEK